jgi:hypothetical protein
VASRQVGKYFWRILQPVAGIRIGLVGVAHSGLT